MSTPHFLVFVGPSPSLSTELEKLRDGFGGLNVIAVAVPKEQRGLSSTAISRSIGALLEELKKHKQHDQPARLTVWAYAPGAPEDFQSLWAAFGKAAWVELLPLDLMHKDRPTRLHIEGRLPTVSKLLHEISHQVYVRRNSSAFPLPFANFRSQLVVSLREYWYHQLDLEPLRKTIQRLSDRFRQSHAREDRSHKDDRSLIFAPARPEAYHGKPHPAGPSPLCFVNGRFRFGTALYPGFHYDVSQSSGVLDCVLYDSEGRARTMGPEKREYINLFPNDYLLPQKQGQK
ncbi:hypothetical protein H8A99_15350 [Bradyrhizobium sp. Arg68]|uniref:hypothetical protein n=1 Tax=Bradyrhizobium ivorense TaxID=2511166 RepID=UPI001E5CF27C|nr:hypothetical protein [Bradyrhizobium ivorense]MCC8937810.1 hypothetical protein [Bradyrhizobium ivorense]